MANEVANLWVTLRAETAPFTRGMRTAAEEGESLTTKMGGLRQTMVKLGAATSLVGVGFAVYGVKAAGDFQQQMNLLVTACGESQANLKKVSDGVLSLARSTGTSTDNLAEGMYNVEKAGYRGADGLKILTAAAQGAREEGAPLNDVVGAMTTVMKNFHIPASKSVQVMNAMKTAAGESKATFAEFSSALSTVLPAAYSAGVSFQDVAGTVATMTQRGETAQHATQLLAGTLRALTSANTPAASALNQLGLTTQKISKDLGTKGLSGTLNEIVAAIQKKMGPSGLYAAGVFKQSAQAAQSLQAMLGKMPTALQKASQAFLDGKMSAGDYRKQFKGMGADGYAMGTQFMALATKSRGFSDGIKSGNGPLTTFQDLLKKATGGATGMQTALLVTGKNAGDNATNIAKVGRSLKDGSKDVEGWAITQKSFNVQMGRLKEMVTTTAITIGLKLIPIILKVTSFFEKHKAASMGLAAVIGTVLTGSVLMFVGKALKPLLSTLQLVGKGAVGLGRIVGKIPWGSGWSGLTTGLKNVGTAFRAAGLAALDFGKKMATSAVAGLRAAAAWTIERVQLLAATIAEKAAAVAQWALNLAQDANPMVWIVLAIAALVAAIVIVATKTTWFQTAWKASWDAIKIAASATWDFLKLMFAAFMSAVDAVVGFVQAHWPLLLAILTGPIGLAVLAIVRYWGKITAGFSAAYHAVVGVGRTLVSWVSGLPRMILGALASLGGSLVSWASSAFGRAKSAAVGAANTLVSWMRGLPHMILGALGNLGNLLYTAGANLIHGFISGVESMAGKVKDSLGNLTSKLTSWKGPPERDRVLLTPAGQMIIEGLIGGMQSRFGHVKAAAESVAQTTITSFSDMLGIASPSKKFAALGAYVVAGLVSGLTGSTARVRAATEHIARSLYTDFGSGHKALQKAVAKDNAELMKLARNRDSVAGRLKAAQSKLAALQKSWTAEKNSVASAIMQSASIVTASPDEGRSVNAFDVVDAMREKVQKATQFAAELDQLRKKGLRTDLIQQLAAAGVDQAGDTALALAAASKGQIQQMNQMQGNLQQAANATGSAVADSMYGAGIKSAQGLVKGLQSQEAAIQKQMMRIALGMQKAIKKALGIRSPSRVFAALGEFIPQGLAQGISTGTRHATTAVHAMAGAVVGAGAMAGLAGGGGAVVNHYHLSVEVEGSVLTERKLVDVVEKGFLKLGARNPATYQPYKR